MMISSCNDPTPQPFSKTICSICYEDLKPIVEDLQAISICGHVFHELCIQQLFGYCSKGKKKCPICKQTCLASNVSRLYFQSVGNLSVSNFSQKLQTHKEDSEELTLEDSRCEGKISGLRLALESREKELINLSYELKKEASLKYEALEQNNTINNLLNLKKQELNKSELELDKLQERNNALAKELAALKLKHKELMTKYETLEIDEASSRKELEKAKEKLKDLENLKKHIQKMETAKEMKDNEVLRVHKAPKKTKDSPSVLNGVDLTHTIIESDVHLRKTKRLRVTENIMGSTNKDGTSSYILIDDDDDDDKHTSKDSILPESPSYDSVPQPTLRATTNDDVAFVHGIGQDKHLSNITNQAPLPARSSQKAEFCFNPGLLGPDGTKSYLGKWCRKRRNKNSNASSISTQPSGDAIAVGSDGRA